MSLWCINRARAAAICFLICAGYAFAGLYPFNFITRNDVRWLAAPPGLSLSGHALVRSTSSIDLSSCPGTSLEFYLEPEGVPSGELRTLFALFSGGARENLLVAQWRRSLLVRTVMQDSRDNRRLREVPVSALHKGARVFLALTSDRDGIRSYVDGTLVRTYPKLALAADNMRGDVILGTGIRNADGWKGKLFGMALFCGSLTASEIAAHAALWTQDRPAELASFPSIAGLYLFQEGQGRAVRDASARGVPLMIPDIYRLPAKRVLSAPWNDWEQALSEKRDILVNILGFIPFGFFFYVYLVRARPGHRLAAALQCVACCCAISLGIELLQGFLPSRSSSLSDVISNTGGGLAGVVFAAVWLLC